MKPRRQATNIVEPGRPLISLSIGANERISQFVDIVEPSRRRDELILSRHNSEILSDLLKEFKHADTVRRHALPVRSKILFCGPPGCGKTMAANVLAHELGLPLYITRIDAIVSSFLGETASNLRKTFDAVSEQTCVFFLDEFDALARSRTDETEHSELRRVVNSLLLMIERFKGRGLLIAATNIEASLDPAVWRRFDEIIFFGPPTEADIKDFLLLKSRNFSAEFNLVSKSKKLKGLSYADIERVFIGGVKQSILDGMNSLRERDFEYSLREERRRQGIKKLIATKR